MTHRTSTLAIAALFGALLLAGMASAANDNHDHAHENGAAHDNNHEHVHEHEEDHAHDHEHEHLHDHSHGHVHDHEAHWIGRLHPPSVHFPIGLLIAALVAEVLFMVTGQQRYAAASWFCAGGGVITAWAAAVLGWLFGGFDLAQDDWLFAGHRWLGTATAVCALVLAWTMIRTGMSDVTAGRTSYRMALTLTALLVGATGFFGGALVWGLEHYGIQL